MKVIFDPSFLPAYTRDPAASPGRLEKTWEKLKNIYEVIAPEPCREEDILLAHTSRHIASIKKDSKLYKTSLLAAGAAVMAAEVALTGQEAFALCRPPGHHASPDSSWGFCYFNNIAVAVKKILTEKKAERIIIVDFDLHYGDGTANALAGIPGVDFFDIPGHNAKSFINNLENYLAKKSTDLVAVSAGFDRHREDWGGMLSTADYKKIGAVLGAFAREKCRGKLFSVLEGGYNPDSLAESTAAFLEGIEMET